MDWFRNIYIIIIYKVYKGEITPMQDLDGLKNFGNYKNTSVSGFKRRKKGERLYHPIQYTRVLKKTFPLTEPNRCGNLTFLF